MDQNHSFIIADHIRAACMIISDGVQPSGKQRGYVLRRLIRRALSASLKLNIDITNKQYFEDLVDSVVSIYDGVYDEVKINRDVIVELLFAEAQKYQRAISVGQKEWAKVLKSV
jgi:alanyl-tRNA synthetase